MISFTGESSIQHSPVHGFDTGLEGHFLRTAYLYAMTAEIT